MYAGTWYEADPEILKNQLDQFLAKATTLDEQSAGILTKTNAAIDCTQGV
jgi:predicted class III extradiol MEMO1 family dioxygenase